VRSDIHHLFPTHKAVNNARGGDPFGEIPDEATAAWYGLSPDGRLAELVNAPSDGLDAFSEDRPDEFEPREGHERNLAHAGFYFYSMFPGRAGPIERIAKDGLASLHRWHLQDPPDAWERQRNERVAAAQGNRNSYIDHPALVCRAWGLDCPP
jgi:endonuclease I